MSHLLGTLQLLCVVVMFGLGNSSGHVDDDLNGSRGHVHKKQCQEPVPEPVTLTLCGG